jgi:hypothetical protein
MDGWMDGGMDGWRITKFGSNTRDQFLHKHKGTSPPSLLPFFHSLVLPSAPKKYSVTQFTSKCVKLWWLNIAVNNVWILPCSNTPTAETVK